MLPVLKNLFDAWNVDPMSRVTFFAIIGFLCCYAASWWVLTVAPVAWVQRQRWLIVWSLTLLFQITAWVASWDYGGAAFMCIYMLSMAAYLTPRRWYPAHIAGVIALALLEALVPGAGGTQLFYRFLIMVFGGGIVIVLSRKVNDLQSERQQQIVVLEQEKQVTQRERISADLHDLLGQTLTAIAVHADVAGKQLNKGQTAAVQQSLNTVSELAREALTDVRQVVGRLREIDIAEEIRRLTVTCASREIEVVASAIPTAWPTEFRLFAGWLVREAGANILHHSSCSCVLIAMDEAGIVGVDNGSGRSSREVAATMVTGARNDLGDNRDGGHGLIGLRQRAANIAHLHWGWVQTIRAEARVAPPQVKNNQESEVRYLRSMESLLEDANWHDVHSSFGKDALPKSGFFVVATRLQFKKIGGVGQDSQT